MIDDILFDYSEFILELPYGDAGGLIESYSMDGFSYDFVSTYGSETSSIFIN
jgi:hypothetical protein